MIDSFLYLGAKQFDYKRQYYDMRLNHNPPFFVAVRISNSYRGKESGQDLGQQDSKEETVSTAILATPFAFERLVAEISELPPTSESPD
jgi:hypothetical protein